MILDRGRWPELALILETVRVNGFTRPDELSSYLMENGDIESPSGSDPRIGIPVGGLRIRSLDLDGFGPYKNKVRMDLHDGLTLVTGANGSGKTTILKAIHWCLFGDIGESDPWNPGIDPSGNNIINWDRSNAGDKRAAVEIVLDIGGVTYRSGRSLADGKMDHETYRIDEDGSEIISPLPPGLSLAIMPFLIFQGESILFLSHEDPFSGEGPLRRALMSLNGGSELTDLIGLVEEARGKLISDMEGLTDRSSPLLEKRISLKGKIDALDGEIGSVKEDLEEAEALTGETSREYRESLAEISKLGNADRGIGDLARRAAELDHSSDLIRKYLDNAGREILRTLTGEALERSLGEKEKKLRSKLLYGAYEAQAEIVSEVMNRKSCICGTEIGKTGMGMDHLEALHRKIIGKQRAVEDWGDDDPWTSDNTLEQVRRILAVEQFNRDDYLDAVRKNRDARDAERELETGPSKRTDRLDAYIKAIKRYEGMKARTRGLRKSLSSLKRKRKKTSGTLQDLEEELVDLWGGSGGSDRYKRSAKLLDACMKQGAESTAEILESGRVRLEKEINSILPVLDPGGHYSKCLIHGRTFGLGRIRAGGDEGVVALNQMSAGERELLALATIFGINRMTGGSLIIDSPFPFMDDERRGRTVKGLPDLIGNGYLSVPSGYLSGEDIGDLEEGFGDRGFTHIRIRRSEGSSRIDVLSEKRPERTEEEGGE